MTYFAIRIMRECAVSAEKSRLASVAVALSARAARPLRAVVACSRRNDCGPLVWQRAVSPPLRIGGVEEKVFD
ncbi:hypothetical protein GOBAR_DD30573 [Gossypium barbadense]|nr:hypothetical protein GOBAR_DD30573 [Gossypium barbadense]